jgi:hypothetical protein
VRLRGWPFWQIFPLLHHPFTRALPRLRPATVRYSSRDHRSALQFHRWLLMSCHHSATGEPLFSTTTFARRKLELQSLPDVCTLSRWHSPRRPYPLWAVVRSLAASPLRLPRACTARRSRTLITVLGSAVAAPHGLAQPLVGCALAGRIPLLSWAACSLSGPRCTVVLGREAVSTHGAVVKT